MDAVNPASRELIGAVIGLTNERAGGRKHHEAMPYASVGAFVRGLRSMTGEGMNSTNVGVRTAALELIILTGTRKNEVLGMRFDEIGVDGLGEAVWRIGGERMKAKVAHVVPLVPRAVEIIEAQRALYRDSDGLVFRSPRGNALSKNAFNSLLAGTGATCHGFRSSLRDWLGDETSHERETAEGILAHVISGVEGTYPARERVA